MGNTCAPSKPDESSQPADVDVKEEEVIKPTGQPSEKLTSIINTYQAENERMLQELEKMKNKDEEDREARKLQAEKNDKMVRELSEMRALMQQKDRALMKHRLEAALHSKATSIVTSEAVTKLLKAGNMQKLKGRKSKNKSKVQWVEIYLHSAQATPEGVNKGSLQLTFADNKDARLANRCQILQVKQEENVGAKFKGKAILLDVFSSGEDSQIVLACDDEKSMEDWIEVCNEGLAIIEEEFGSLQMEADVFFDVEISKPKLGIRVEEKSIEIGSGVDEKVAEAANGVDVAIEAEEKEKPCELVVKTITEESLIASGLTPDCVVSAINGTNIRGMPYTKQIGLFESTKKPFKITFLRRKAAYRTAFPGILKELVSDGDNEVKSTFYELVKGTQFGIELDESEDKTATITELLSNQRRLTALLQNTRIQEAEL